MKFNYLITIVAIVFSLIEYIQSTATHMFTYSHNKVKKSKPKATSDYQMDKKLLKKPKNFNMPEASTYWQGWVKYFHYSNNTHYPKPPSLFQNNEYFKQRVPINDVKKKDRSGYLNIPNKAAFYLVLHETSINFFSKRDNILIGLIDSLKLDDILPVPEDNPTKGGIVTLGDFPFGSCLEISTKSPVSFGKLMKREGTWIICAETNKAKNLLKKFIINLKIKRQRVLFPNEKIVSSNMNSIQTKTDLGSLISNPTGKRKSLSVEKAINGYWIKLQDWTPCNKQCGGGLEFEQWMCVPPKNGGAPCFGPAIKTRPCNTQACPSVNNLLATTKNGAMLSPKPIIKVGKFSSRPQRYSKCLVRENDAFITEMVDDKDINGKDIQMKIKKPIRIVMNNHTISVFRDDSYEELAYTFDLVKTNFLLEQHPCCYSIQDQYKNLEVCSYDSECNKITNDWVKSWEKDFNLFKHDCHSGLQVELITAEDEIKLEEQLKENEEAEANKSSDQKILNIKKDELKKKLRVYVKQKKLLEDNTFKVISKEIQLENMVQAEAQQKEAFIERKLENKIAIEQKKQECLEKSFEEKELDEDFNESVKDSLSEQDEIKKEAAKKIEEGRWKLRKNLMVIKSKAKARDQVLSQKLNHIRSKMSKEIILANKDGSVKNCEKGRKDRDYRETYCNGAFTENWMKNSSCKSDEEFCYTCCEYEFGVNFITGRDNCYDMCDHKTKITTTTTTVLPTVTRNEILQPKTTPDQSGGYWTWVAKEKTNSSKFE